VDFSARRERREVAVRIAILGAGGVGGYYGGVLALAGHDVTLFARGAHLDALRERGLEVRTPEGTRVAAVAATDDSSP
jgi:2-dehydropantoate 2-reductase